MCRNTIVRLSLVAVFTVCAKFSDAAPPIAYDSWTATNGNITASCPPGASCTILATDNGFLNREVRLEGRRYFQVILTDVGVTGNANADAFSAARGNIGFSDEVTVLAGAPSGYFTGIANKMRITESQLLTPQLESRAELTTVFQIGSSGKPETANFIETINNATYGYSKDAGFDVQINQEFGTVDYSGVNPLLVYSSTASIREFFNGSAPIDFTKRFDQYIDLGAGGGQVFRHWHDGGVFQDSSRAANPTSPLLPGGTNGGDIAWGPNSVDPKHASTGAVGDDLSVTYVGHQQDQGGQFSFTKFVDKNTFGTSPSYNVETSLSSLVTANPGGWDAAFGTVPDPFAGPQVVTATAPITPPSSGLVPTMPNQTPLSGTGGGGPPIAYDSYTVANGVITADCPLGQCVTTVSDNGFLQRAIHVLGSTYYQTIITSDGATGDPTIAKIAYSTTVPFMSKPAGSLDFTDETFIRSGSGDNTGVASKLAFAEFSNNSPTYPLVVTDSIEYGSTLNTGWAQGGAADPILKVNQDLVSGLTLTGTYNRNSFDMIMLQDESKDMTIKSTIGMLAERHPIDFVTRILQGSFVTLARDALSGGPLLPGGSNGGDIAWAAGDTIQATWVGGMSYNRLIPISVYPFETQSFTNLTTGTTTSLTNLYPAVDGYGPFTFQPISWPTLFGAAPVWDTNAATPPN